MINKSRPCVRRNNQAGDSEPIAVLIDLWGSHMIVKASVIVPSDDNRCVLPEIASHNGIDQLCYIPQTSSRIVRRMFAIRSVGYDPANAREAAALDIRKEISQRHYVFH